MMVIEKPSKNLVKTKVFELGGVLEILGCPRRDALGNVRGSHGTLEIIGKLLEIMGFWHSYFSSFYAGRGRSALKNVKNLKITGVPLDRSPTYITWPAVSFAGPCTNPCVYLF